MKAAARFLSLSLVLITVLSPCARAGVQNLSPPGLAAGAGIWANLWHRPCGDLDSYCLRLRANGIVNLFLQTSRSNTEALVRPYELGAIIEACHRHKIRVIAWSFAELNDAHADAERLIAAAQFQSPAGQRFDGIAGNMEKNLSRQLIESYSRQLRVALGQTYPMIAVVYSPLNRAPGVATIPWPSLAQYWSVIAPMTYWGGRYQKLDAYTYARQTIACVRKASGRPDVEIHLIGDGMGTTGQQVQQFFRACSAGEATSASLYPNCVPTAEQLACLGRYHDYFPLNSRFRLAALRELLNTHVLALPPDGDPSAAVSRQEFYQLVARQLFKRNPAEPLALKQALEILDNAGVIPALPRQEPDLSDALARPVGSLEALSVIARSLEFAGTSKKAALAAKMHGNKGRRADRWLIEPAAAEAGQHQGETRGTLNFFDAAQMVLQARAGLL